MGFLLSALNLKKKHNRGNAPIRIKIHIQDFPSAPISVQKQGKLTPGRTEAPRSDQG